MKREQIGDFLSSYRDARTLFEGETILSHVITNMSDLPENDPTNAYHKVNGENYAYEVNRILKILHERGFRGNVDVYTSSEYSVQRDYGFDDVRTAFNQTLIQMGIGENVPANISKEDLLQTDHYSEFVHELQQALRTEEDPEHTGLVIITIRRTEVVPQTP